MGTVYKRENKWYIDYYDSNGKRIRKVVGNTKRDALRILAEKERTKYLEKEDVSIPVSTKLNTKEFFENFIQMKSKRISESTMHIYKFYIDFWRKQHISRTFSPLSRLKIEHVINNLSTKDKNRTVNNYLKLLKQIYNYAIQLRVISYNPAKDIKLLRESHDGRPRFFTEEEVKKIIEHSNDFYVDLWKFFLYTGMRRDEVRLLKWEQINLEKSVIYIQHKGKRRELPIHPKVREIITNRQQKSEYVFPNEQGIHYSPHTWNLVLKGILKKTGIENASIHTFRHTFASWLVMEGIDLRTIAHLLGHSDIKTTMIYSHLAPDHVQKAIQRLPESF